MELFEQQKKRIKTTVLIAMLAPPMGWMGIILGSQLMSFDQLLRVLVNPIFYVYCFVFIGFMFWRTGSLLQKLINQIRQDQHLAAHRLIRRIPREFLFVTMIYGVCGPPAVCTGVGLSEHEFTICWILGPIVISTFALPFYNKMVIQIEAMGSQIPVKVDNTLSVRGKFISSILYLNIGVISMLTIVFYNMMASGDSASGEMDNTFVITLVSFSLVGMAVVAIPLILQTNHLEKSLKKAAQFISATSKGALGNRLPVESRDELGLLVSSTNNLLSVLVQLIGSIQQEMTGIQKISREFSTVSEGVNHVGHNLDRNVKHLTDFSQKQDAEVSKFNDLSAQLEKHATDFQTTTQEGTAKYQEFHTSFGAMKEKLETITGISRQTKLLAINASIEAKSAGDAGLGFQVVAREVGRLSDLTHELSTQIEEQTTVVETSAEAMKNLILSLEKAANEVQSIVQVINTSNKERTEDAKSVNELVGELRGLVQSSNQQANNLISGAESLESSTRSLTNSAGFFQVKD